MEQLLHYVWKHKIFPLSLLQTTSGRPVEVIDPGLPNMNAGPDFFNAKLKIDGTLWVGNVEVHTQASDWLLHRHDRDKAYDTVILHVVGESNCDVMCTARTVSWFPRWCSLAPTLSACAMKSFGRQRFILPAIPSLPPSQS